jgi:hypothetical protein
MSVSDDNDNFDNDRFGVDYMDGSDIPFLVTHWLAGYEPSVLPQTLNQREKEAAVLKIRQAAATLASAFTELEAFGPRIKSQLIQEQQVRKKALHWPFSVIKVLLMKIIEISSDCFTFAHLPNIKCTDK